LTILLLNDYLGSVSYGFKKDGVWVLGLKYIVGRDGTISTDDRSGRVTPGKDIEGAHWSSFLIHSQIYFAALPFDRDKIMASIPINRTNGQEPKVEGVYTSDRTYSNGGISLSRQSFSKS
jgi:hypothetical protein